MKNNLKPEIETVINILQYAHEHGSKGGDACVWIGTSDLLIRIYTIESTVNNILKFVPIKDIKIAGIPTLEDIYSKSLYLVCRDIGVVIWTDKHGDASHVAISQERINDLLQIINRSQLDHDQADLLDARDRKIISHNDGCVPTFLNNLI